VAKADKFRLVDAYYQKAPGGPDHVPGQICDAIAFHLLPKLEVLKFDYDAANRGEEILHEIGAPDAKSFDHPPVYRPRKLDQREALAVVPAKRRPGIILSSPLPLPGKATVVAKDFPEAFLIAPLYSFQDTHSEEFRRRVQALEYSMLFYLPDDDTAEIHEGFLRFDRAVVVPKGLLRVTPYALTEDAHHVLKECFHWFLTGQLKDEQVADARKIYLEAIERPTPS
jgi:hypothetical protein